MNAVNVAQRTDIFKKMTIATQKIQIPVCPICSSEKSIVDDYFFCYTCSDYGTTFGYF